MSKAPDETKTVLKRRKAPAKEEQKIKSAELTNTELEQVSGGIATQDLTALKYIGADSPPTSEQVFRIKTILKNKIV